MRFIADLHVHSKYARACSPALTPENIAAWCKVKGVDIIATGDFTHPRWFEELKTKLRPSEKDGLYLLRDGLTQTLLPPIPLPKKPTFFCLVLKWPVFIRKVLKKCGGYITASMHLRLKLPRKLMPNLLPADANSALMVVQF